MCDDKTRAHFLGNGYASLGWMNTTTLDDALLTVMFDQTEGVLRDDSQTLSSCDASSYR